MSTTWNTHGCLKVRLWPSLLLLTLLAASGCGTAPETQSTATLSAGLPLPPFPDGSLTPRQVSNQDLTFPGATGDLYSAASAGITTEAGLAHLNPAAGALAWTMYGLANPNCHIIKLFPDLQITGECWIAVADFSAERWELKGPFTEDPAEILLGERHQGPTGDVWCAVLAYDGAQVTVDKVRPNIRSGTHLEHLVTDDVGVFTFMALGNVSGHPAIVFYDQSDSSLRCAVADNPVPAHANDWRVTTISADDVPGIHAAVVGLDGKPAVVFSTQGDSDLYFAYASQMVPDSDDDWTLQPVDTANDTGYHCSLAVVAGRPLIAYFERDAADLDGDSVLGYLRLAHLTDGTLAGGWSSYRIANSGTASCQPAIADKSGVGAIAFLANGDEVRYTQAAEPYPTSGFGWSILPAALGSAEPGELHLDFVAGRPIIFYRSPAQFNKVLGALALDVDPTQGGGQWNFTEYYNTTDQIEDYAALVMRDKPIIMTAAYYDSSQTYNLNIFRYIAPLVWPGDPTMQGNGHISPSQVSALSMAEFGDNPAFAYFDVGGSGGIYFQRLVYMNYPD